MERLACYRRPPVYRSIVFLYVNRGSRRGAAAFSWLLPALIRTENQTKGKEEGRFPLGRLQRTWCWLMYYLVGFYDLLLF